MDGPLYTDSVCPGQPGYHQTPCPPKLAQDTGSDVRKENDADDVGKEESNGDIRTDGDDEVQRATWSNKRDYILSMMGCSIGVGNIWRFPYICIRNGGGAFLIPFLLSVVLFGLPLFFLESALGQFTARGPLHVWGVCPLVKGVGVSSFIVVLLSFWYYNIILAWGLYFLASCCRFTLPWTQCNQWWNTERCHVISRDAAEPMPTNISSGAVSNISYNWMTNSTYFEFDNLTSAAGGKSKELKMVSSAEEFWQHNVLQVSGGLHEPGHVVWYLVVSLALVSLVLFLGLSKGIKTSGKVVYVTVTAPYVLLTILMVRGLTLPGSGQGILFYLTPDFTRLADYNVWMEAALQVFWSLGPCYGPVIALSSYNKFHNNCLRDSVFLTLICEGTSLYAGLAIFSVLGYMAHETGLPIDQVVSSGPGLAFIVYPEALSLMPLSHLWAVLFFLMVITVTFDSATAHGESLLTDLHDWFPKVFHRHRPVITAVFCAVFFLLQLPFITEGGVYLFQLVDWFISALSSMMIGVVECAVLAWVYGYQRFEEDIQLMLGRRPPVIFKVLWRFVTPLVLLVLWVITIARYEPPVYGDYHYDTWGHMLGWTVAGVSVIPLPVVALVQLVRAQGTLLERLRQVTRPDETWRPAITDSRLLHKSSVSGL